MSDEVGTAKVLGDIEGLYQRVASLGEAVGRLGRRLDAVRDGVHIRLEELERWRRAWHGSERGEIPMVDPGVLEPGFPPMAPGIPFRTNPGLKIHAWDCAIPNREHRGDCLPLSVMAPLVMKPHRNDCPAHPMGELDGQGQCNCGVEPAPEAKPKEASERWPVDYAKARNDAAEVKRLKEDVAAWIMRFAQNQAEVKRLTDQECYLMECLDGISHWSACDRNAITGGGRGVCLRCQLEDEQAEVKRLTEKNADQRRDVENYRDEVKRLNAAVQDEARKVMEREAEVKRLRETVARVEKLARDWDGTAASSALRRALRGQVEEGK